MQYFVMSCNFYWDFFKIYFTSIVFELDKLSTRKRMSFLNLINCLQGNECHGVFCYAMQLLLGKKILNST